jgi:hypothetical protein
MPKQKRIASFRPCPTRKRQIIVARIQCSAKVFHFLIFPHSRAHYCMSALSSTKKTSVSMSICTSTEGPPDADTKSGEQGCASPTDHVFCLKDAKRSASTSLWNAEARRLAPSVFLVTALKAGWKRLSFESVDNKRHARLVVPYTNISHLGSVFVWSPTCMSMSRPRSGEHFLSVCEIRTLETSPMFLKHLFASEGRRVYLFLIWNYSTPSTPPGLPLTDLSTVFG